jgi:multidrug resistance efflux pump
VALSGNWIKVVQRIPVRLAIDCKPGAPVLRDGMRRYSDQFVEVRPP